ncbi:MAG: type II toxin-antitoxin system VapC family toxin [Phycisphaerae bacterium]
MNRCVPDASTVAVAFFRERHAAKARSLLTSETELHAPDLIAAELANVIWKRHRRREIDIDEAGELLRDFQSLPVSLTPSQELADVALELALRTDRTVYDCLYVALAVRLNCPMITADKRLVNALSKTPLADHVMWLGDLP